MNNTPSGERIHIGIFGRTNAGKSSLINAITGQNLSIVSAQPGTTTDPVRKSMELLPLGPVVLIDTPGIDDRTQLGELRAKRAFDAAKRVDIAVMVAEADVPPSDMETELIRQLRGQNIPVLIALNKIDRGRDAVAQWRESEEPIEVSAATGQGVDALKEALSKIRPAGQARMLARDLVPAGSVCILVAPIDEGAPKGRLILPQQQVIRDLLEGGCGALVVRDDEYAMALSHLAKPPALVITDSQVFGRIAQLTPPDIPLTSFSMLFARYKGDLPELVKGARAADSLREGDRVLIGEGCTHHRQCEDIGSVKIPKWLKAHAGCELIFDFASGGGFPDDLSAYQLIVHCGGCTLTQRDMGARIAAARAQGIPIVNYGVLIAHINGILARCIEPLGLSISCKG